MTPDFILSTYLLLLAFQVYTSFALGVLNFTYIKRRSGSVPLEFAGSVDPETYKKSVAYSLAKQRLSLVSGIVLAAFLVWVVLSGFFGRLDSYIAGYDLGSYLHGIVFVVGVGVIFGIVELPFKIYSTFVIEERFGFNKTTAKQWIVDKLKGMLVGVIISVPLILLLFWFMDSAGESWWIYGFIVVAALQLLLLYLFPVFIAPLFNKFTPLNDGELKEKIFSLADQAGFKTSGIFVMDGSKRSTHANAYLTGLGSSKRIVLFDTLLATLSIPETLSVLAHEIGHLKRHHTKKLLAASLLLSFVSFWVMGQLLNFEPLFKAFGLSVPSYHGALVIIGFAFSPVTFFLSPLFASLSRQYEYEADRFASEMVKNSTDLGNALLNLSKKSLSNLTPHPWYSFFHYSHPTLYERLKALRES